MENQLQIFNNEKFGSVRIAMVDDKPYFCGSDVAKTLGYSNPQKAIRDHCKKGIEHFVQHPQSPTKTIQMVFIPESDVYRLIIKSKLPEAQKVEEWLFEEVLPSINHNGYYVKGQEKMNDTEKDIVAQAMAILQSNLQQAQDDKKILIEYIQENEEKVHYYNELIDTSLLLNIRDVAKEVGMTQTKFIQYLINKKILYRDKNNNLRPYGKYVEKEYFALKEFVNKKTSSAQTLFTVEGRNYILKRLKIDGMIQKQ